MKKRFTFLLILIFVLGLTIINFNSQLARASSGPIAHWNFDEGSGTTLNDIKGGKNGIITGATWTTGFRGNALSFDGVDDYVLTENVPVLNAYTISFVVKSGGADPVAGLYPRIINTPANRADIAIVNGDKIYYNIKGDTFHDSLCIASTNSWSFITMTYDGLSRKFYQNGALKHVKNVSGAGLIGPNSQPGGLSFGRNSSYGENDSYAKIYLDDVKLYDKVLSDSEILAEYVDRDCAQDLWGCDDWNECQSNSQQTRNCAITKECSFVDTSSPATTQSCAYVPPVCTSWTYSNWGQCISGGGGWADEQTRSILSSSPTGCGGGNPVTTQKCTLIVPCTIDDFNCSEWDNCNSAGYQYRTCLKKTTSNCASIITTVTGFKDLTPTTKQVCTYIPTCTINNWSCDSWSNCSANGNQTRNCKKTSNCQNGISTPATSQSCTPPCYSDTWSCGNWTTCSSNGSQTRICNKTNDCTTADTPSPLTIQNCIPPQPTCTADTWTCEAWGVCSLSGIQSRNCSKTFDCPSVQTAPPITDQFCEAPNRPQQTAPSESEEITNQDTIIKATVKLLCPVDERQASQGSGTVIDSAGTILTNKHVIAGTLGCLVGFIDDFSDEPYFGDRQIADIVKVSSNQDIAVLKIRNPKNKALPYVNTTNGNVNFALGTKITTYGYPAKFGTKVTYTSGDFSGNDGGFFKTTAILEYGNSGGGAYLKNGTYIGIPSAVVKGELNAMGYILSINTIRAWLNNSSVASGATNNNYSRVSVLEDIDLKKLGSLKLFIPDVDKNSNLVAPPTNQNTQKTTDQSQVTPQQESVVIESNDLNKDSNTSSVQDASTTPEQQPQKITLIKRFFLWLSNLFNRLATK